MPVGKKNLQKEKAEFAIPEWAILPLFKIQVESEFHLHQQDTKSPLQSTCLPR